MLEENFMRVKLLIATTDSEYVDFLSDNISETHADTIEVSVCSTLECLRETLPKQRFDVALMDTTMAEAAEKSSINQTILLWSESDTTTDMPELERILKYQRISSITSSVLERQAMVSKGGNNTDSRKAKITAIWSPAGGVGKTTVAIAYATSKVSEDNEVFYLNLETFSSVPCYFNESGKSISRVFEMLESHDGDTKMLIQGISCRDSGITYLCSPDNYDDICILSKDDVKELLSSCSALADELVIDLSCTCDFRTRQVFELADKVLIVTEPSQTSEAKLSQFTSQNDVFESIKEKLTFVANKGAVINNIVTESAIQLPFVQSSRATEVYKVLSENNFWA